MPTIANGNEVEIHVPITGDVTITPSGGHVEFGCNPPSGTDAPASRKVYVAETITIPAGSQMFLRAVGGSATYTDVLGVDDRLQALVSGAGNAWSSDPAENTAAAQAALNATGRVSFTTPGVWLFDTTASPLLIPDFGSLYKGPGVILKVASGSPSALITNHTARLAPVATVPGAQVTYGTAPDGRNSVGVVAGLTAGQLAAFPVNSYVSVVVLGHGALGAIGTAHNNRGYRGVHRVVFNNGVTLQYELDNPLWPGSSPAQAPVSLYRVTREPLVWGPGEIDGNGANSDPAYNTGDPRGVPVWWHHAFSPRMEGGTFKRGRTWTIGANYVRHLRISDVLARIRDDAVSSPSNDFIHLCGQHDDTIVSGSAGDSGDNFVGFTEDCTEGTIYNFPFQFPGDMNGVRVVNTAVNSTSDHGAFGAIAMYGPAAYRYADVAVIDLRTTSSASVQLSNYGATNMNNLTIDTLRVIRAVGTNGGATVETTTGVFTLGQLLLEDVHNTRPDVPTLNISTASTGSIRSLQLSRVGVLPYNGTSHSRSVPIANFGGINITALSIDGCEGIELNANVVAFSANGAGNIGKVAISNCSATGSGTAALWGDSGAGTAATPTYFNSTYNGIPLSVSGGGFQPDVADFAALLAVASPAAGDRRRTVAPVTAGGAPYARWVYDGTLWRLDAPQVLLVDVTSATGVTGTSEQFLKQILLPANFWPSLRYFVMWVVSAKTGTTDSWSAIRLRMGINGGAGDAAVCTSISGQASGRQYGIQFEGLTPTATTFQPVLSGQGFGMPSGSTSGVAFPASTTIPNTSGAIHLSLSVQMSGSTDTPSITRVIFEAR